ncbi:PPC domain-containing protein [Pyxidicoccus sp. 3LG]
MIPRHRHRVAWLGCLLLLVASACGRADVASPQEPDLLATTGQSLTNGVPVSPLSGLKGSQQIHTLNVPSNATRLTVTLTRGSGDPDLYIRRGSAPTTATYDCRSTSTSAVDSCVVTAPQAGTWYVMVLGYSDYSGTSLVATYETAAPTVVALTAGQSVLVSGAKDEQRYFTLQVPPGQKVLNFKTSGGAGDADLFVQFGTPPTITTFRCASTNAGSTEQCSINNPEAGTWHVMLRGYAAFSNVPLVGEYAPLANVLGNGQSVVVGDVAGSQRYWTLEVPAGQTALRFRTEGGTGNVDLYVSFGSPPTTTTATCTSATSTNAEYCSVTSPQAGLWYVMLRGAADYAGVTLSGYTQSAGGSPVVFLSNDSTTKPPRAEAGDAFHYSLEVPAGQTQLRVRLYSSGNGNGNLYVRFGDKASLTAYDCRSEGSYIDEECVIANPQPGTWFILVHNVSATSGVYLQAAYQNGEPPPIVLTNGKPSPLTALLPDAQSRLYTLEVPPGYAKLRISARGITSISNAKLYASVGAAPVPGGLYTECGWGPSCDLSEPVAGTWYVRVVSTSGVVREFDLLATYSGELPPAVALVNGQAVTGISASKDDVRTFTLNVPAGQGRLVLDMANGAGVARVYARAGARPTTSMFNDCIKEVHGTRESCVFNSPRSGTWYIQVHADQEVSGVSLKGTYSPLNPRGTTLPLSNGQWVRELSGTPMVDLFFTFQVPPGAQSLKLESVPGVGEAHVYLKQGVEPTSGDYTCKDKCELTKPTVGTWYARVRGVENYSGFALRLSYQLIPALSLGEWVGPMTLSYGASRGYRLEVPSGLSALSIGTRVAGEAPVAIYTAVGAVPTSGASCNIVQPDGGRRCTFKNPQPGTWFVTVVAEYLSVEGLSLHAFEDRLPDAMVGIQDNVPMRIVDLAGRYRIYTLEVPSGQTLLNVDLLTREDAELFIKHGSAPTAADFKCSAVSSWAQPGASCTVPAPSAGTWYAMVKAADGFSGVLRATTASIRGLVDGVPDVPVAGAEGEERLYRLEVPEGMSDLTFTLRDATKTSHLFVRYGAPPDGTTADCTFGLQGKDEDTCAFTQPQAGTWYAAIRGVSAAFAGAVLTATSAKDAGEGVPSLTRGVPVLDIAGRDYERKLWKLEVPEGQDVLKFDLFDMNGSPYIYVQHAVRPTPTQYLCTSLGSTGKAATCTVRNPAPGTWFVMTRENVAYSGAVLTGTWWREGDTQPLTRGVPRVNLSGTPDLAQYFQVEVPPGQSALSLDLFGTVAKSVENAVMTVRYGALPGASDTACAVKSYYHRACELQDPAPGTWYVRLSGTFTGLSLSADHVGLGATDGIQPLLNGGSQLSQSCISASNPVLYKLEVPPGMSRLTFTFQGGSSCSGVGHADLRVLLGSPPTLNDYDCLSNGPENDEACTIQRPVAGTWYVLVSGSASGSNVTGSYE